MGICKECSVSESILGINAVVPAIVKGHPGCLKHLLQAQNGLKVSPTALLQLSAFEKQLRCVKILLTFKQAKAHEALHFAVRGNADECLEKLLKRLDIANCGVDSNTEAYAQVGVVVRLCAQRDQLSSLRVVLDKAGLSNKFGYTALVEAAKNKSIACLRYLASLEVPSVSPHPNEEEHPIHLALETENEECLRLVLQVYIKGQVKDVKPTTLTDIVSILKKRTLMASLDDCIEKSLLRFRPQDGSMALGERLLIFAFEKGKMINESKTAVELWQTTSGDAVAGEKILSFWPGEISVDAPDALGSTLLMKAARMGMEDVVKALLFHGADPLKKDSQGKSALIWSNLGSHSGCYEMLKRHVKAAKLGKNMSLNLRLK